MTNRGDDADVIRMNVHVAREEHPDLFEELKKFGKGTKRIQRLKTLASERLLLAGRIITARAEQQAESAPSDRSQAGADELAAVHELCLPPLS